MGAAARLLGGQILLQRRLLEAAQAAEQIHLVGGHAQAHAVLGLDVAVAGLAQVRGLALAGAVAVHGQLRVQRRALDAVLGTGLGHVQQGQTQVPVVAQRGADQLLQLRVLEQGFPARQHQLFGDPPIVAGAGGHRRFRLLVVRCQGAAGHGQGGEQRGQGFAVHSRASVHWPLLEPGFLPVSGTPDNLRTTT